MWVNAKRPGTIAHEWNKTYSVGPTKVLVKLACTLMVNIIGIGSAERHWNIVKAVKTGQRANTGTIKCKKQACVYDASMQQKARC